MLDIADFPSLDLERRWSDKNPPHRQIATYVRRLITEGHIPAGEYLPSGSALARHLQVHRATVHSGYQLLDDLTETVKGIGRRVRPLARPQWACLMARVKDGMAGMTFVAGFPNAEAAEEWGVANSDSENIFLHFGQVQSPDEFEKGTR